MNIDVGSKIRSLRKSKNISISTLAKKFRFKYRLNKSN